MRRGPKPQPTAIKLLRGVKPSRINQAEPKPAANRPERPEHLDSVAAGEWDRIVPILERMKVLTEADGPALAIYCDSYSRWIRARIDVAKRGMIIEVGRVRRNKAGEVVDDQKTVKLNPALQVEQAAKQTMLNVLGEFGLTPASRSRIKTSDEKEDDQLGAFLNRRGG